MAGFRRLVDEGKILRWGVSNFDLADMQELVALEHGRECAANQVYYSLSERGIEFELKPWHDSHGIVTMAYCPLDEGRLPRHRGLQSIADGYGASAGPAGAGVADRARQHLADPDDELRRSGRCENCAALNLSLSDATLAELDRLFPPPDRKTRLKIV